MKRFLFSRFKIKPALRVVGPAVLLVALFSGCTCRSSPWTTPTLELPQSEHAFALPIKNVLMVSGGMEADQIEEYCEESRPLGLPPQMLAPAMVVISLEEMAWMGAIVAPLKNGLVAPELVENGTINSLFEAAENTQDATNYALRVCKVNHHFPARVALLVIDERVPMETIKQVLYTLGQARYHRFAYAVMDPEPRPSRPADPVSDACCGTLVVRRNEYKWQADPRVDEVRLPRPKPFPHQFGESTPPAISVSVGLSDPFAEFVQVQDALAGVGVYCVHPGVPGRDSSEVRINKGSGSPTKLEIHPNGTIAVHTIEAPLIGPTEPVTRLGGARCSALHYIRGWD